VVDNETVIDGLSGAFRNQQNSLDVLVECDTGAARCGVQTPQAVAQLALTIAAAEGLNFAGLMTYPPINGVEKVQDFMESAVSLLREQNIDCPAISSGGTPDMWRAHEAPITSEVRVGTYIYNDRSLVERGNCEWQDCALTVVATVVSVPTENRAVIDAGSKILTSDLIGLENYGHVSGRPDLTVKSLSEEHGVLTCADSDNIGLEVGDQIQIVPNHCCVVSNMVDRVALRRTSGDIDMIDVSARGCIT
ncbi:MAG: alanine racemase, partial [Proteobacteria bacterium]|nr:alanine racemase [Pseudomonadota bacterium]